MSNILNIGIIASGYRPIRDGREYEKFFTKADDTDRIIIENGDVDATVDLMEKVVWKYIEDTKKIAAYLKKSTLRDTCQNIWNFLYHHIQYRLDKKGLEQLRRPNRSWAERHSGIDCDCFSIFVSSILTNLKIPHFFRIARYNKDVFQHVYVIVPISGTSGHYTIDCVLNKFNYEKPFTEKKDFAMSLNGINVAVLSGADTTDVMDVISGLDDLELLGATDDARRSQAIYEHLVKTRNLVAQKPYLIAQVDYPPAFLKMLDYAIENWHTSNRTAALENLARNENMLNRINGMDGVPDDSDLDGADEDWSHLDGLSAYEIQEELNGKRRLKVLRKAFPKATSQASKRGRKKKKGFFRKVGQAVKKGVQKGVKAFIRFNPLTISARNGFLLALKLNFKKMASKLKWGYATREQAAAKGISAQQWQKSKNALAKVENLFVDKLQGKRSALRNAILKGKAGGLSGFDDEEEIEILGLGIAPAAAMATAIPVITAALKIMVNSGVMKKSEAQNAESSLNTLTANADSTDTDQNNASSDSETILRPSSSDDGSSSSSSIVPSSSSDSSQNSSPETPSASTAENSTPTENSAEQIATEETPQETTTSSESDASSPEPAATEENQPDTSDTDNVETAEVVPDSTDTESDSGNTPNEETEQPTGDGMDGIIDFVQKQPMLAIGGLALGIWGLSRLFSGSKPPGKGLSGTPVHRRKKKKAGQTKTKKQKHKHKRKLKAITLK